MCCDKLHVGDNVTKRAKMSKIMHNAAKKFDWVRGKKKLTMTLYGYSKSMIDRREYS